MTTEQFLYMLAGLLDVCEGVLSIPSQTDDDGLVVDITDEGPSRDAQFIIRVERVAP